MAKSRFESGKGPSQRQLRVGELLRRTLSDVLMRGEIHDEELLSMLITVGEVTVTADLKIATVWVMPLGGKDPQAAIEALKRNRGELRRAISREVTMKHSPDLRFRVDETFDRLEDTRRMFADERVQRDINAPDRDDETPDGEDRDA
ncbi:30S ribosome-binding factor RbfA [Jannaschia pohangensis]|uniref:Ribosome-binding factor A n=1 Tax=Jannaschia pohangensis TaxID=390807 RepID=A0A1I3NG65_9RHOB|nr:30S ribosome-binding factor RbfA [Jannaschia pohangensis]SFJ08127.1 ribosome-binding factor A [Jannaschia pohangensis]